MFKDKILAQLVAKFPGVSKKFLGLWADKLATKVTEEAKIEEAISGLDNLPVSIPDLALEFQREGDARVTEAEATWKKKTPPAPAPAKTDPPKPADPAPADPEPDPNVPSWAKALIDSNKALTEKLAGLEKDKTVKTIKETLATHEKLKGVPATFYEEWVMPEKVEDVDAFAEKVATKYSGFKQTSINEEAGKQRRPVSGTGGKEAPDVKEIDSVVDKMM
jgi:hypothetical protein